MNVRDVDLNLLRVFDAVLRERGVTPAAAGLGLTQPAVSNALSRLRDMVQMELRIASKPGSTATPTSGMEYLRTLQTATKTLNLASSNWQ